jgi:hypothetical protein
LHDKILKLEKILHNKMSFIRGRPQGTIFSQLGIMPNQINGASQEDVMMLKTELATVKQQLMEEMEMNRRLMKEIEVLSLVRDEAYRLAALQEFLGIGVEEDPNAKLSSNELSIEFMTWALAEKGLMISDDETKAMMRKLHNIPKEQYSKFPYRGHNNEYFYKGRKWKTVNNQIQQTILPQLPQVSGLSSPRSPTNSGVMSPAPVMSKQ